MKVLRIGTGTKSNRFLLPFDSRLEVARLGIRRRDGIDVGEVIPIRQVTRLGRVLNGKFAITDRTVGTGGENPSLVVVQKRTVRLEFQIFVDTLDRRGVPAFSNKTSIFLIGSRVGGRIPCFVAHRQLELLLCLSHRRHDAENDSPTDQHQHATNDRNHDQDDDRVI